MSQKKTNRLTPSLIISFLLWAVATFFLKTYPIYAQQFTGDIALTAIPPRLGDDFTLTAKPGELIQTSVRVRNTSDSPLNIQTTVEDFILDEDGRTPVSVQEDVATRWSIANWTSLSPNSQVIQPNKSATINILINVPEDALAGGHYGMILHQPAPAGTEVGGTSAAIGQRVGTLIYLVVEGPINQEAFIRNLTFPKFTEYGPVPFSFEIDNVSDIHIQPKIGIEIYNMFGQKVDTLEVESKNVFPFVARSFDGIWERTWGIGLYRAKVVMSYGESGQVAIAQTNFWLLPITLVIVGTIILLSIITIIVAISKHLNHRSHFHKRKVEALEKKIRELENK